MNRLQIYMKYRRNSLRNAWHIADMNRVAFPALRWSAIAILAIVSAVMASRQAEAIQDAADNRVASTLRNQAALIAELSKVVSACTGEKEGAVWIDDKLYLCGLAPTGERR